MPATPSDIRQWLNEDRCVEALVAAWPLTDLLLTADVYFDVRTLVFRACRQMVAVARASDTERQAANGCIDELLNRFPPPNLLIANSHDPTADTQLAHGYRALVIRTHLLCGRAALGGSWCATAGAVSTEELEQVVVQLQAYRADLLQKFRSDPPQKDSPVPRPRMLPHVTLGLVRDLTELLLGQPVRPAIRRERLNVPVIVDDSAGQMAILDLELVAPGRGEMYVDPELAFVYRDERFVQGEQAAWQHAKRVFAEDAGEPELDLDVRWRLSRRKGTDGQEIPFTRLTGDSASGAFGLGTWKLLAG